MTALKLKVQVPTEDVEAERLIQWARVTRWKDTPIFDLLIMIPNGAYLGPDTTRRAITMARMKRMGFKVGVSDYLLPVPRSGRPGLWLELKRQKGGSVSDEQWAFHEQMAGFGWAVAVAKGWEHGSKIITEYLG